MNTKKIRDRLRQQGRDDFLAGKPITAYFDIELPTNFPSESGRASYELGWREEKRELRREEARQRVSGESEEIDQELEEMEETEAQQCRRMAEMLRNVPGGIGEVIDYLVSRADELENTESFRGLFIAREDND